MAIFVFAQDHSEHILRTARVGLHMVTFISERKIYLGNLVTQDSKIKQEKSQNKLGLSRAKLGSNWG